MKALIILMPKDFRDEEFKIPKERLEDAGISVTVVGFESTTTRGMFGTTAIPDLLIDNVDIDDYDAVIIPGGSGSPKYLWNDHRVLDTVKKAYEKGKVVAAICLSGAVLANSGILNGKNATVFASPDAIKVLKDKGANYLKRDVVVDGKIVTAEGPKAAGKFADEILRLLGK